MASGRGPLIQTASISRSARARSRKKPSAATGASRHAGRARSMPSGTPALLLAASTTGRRACAAITPPITQPSFAIRWQPHRGGLPSSGVIATPAGRLHDAPALVARDRCNLLYALAVDPFMGKGCMFWQMLEALASLAKAAYTEIKLFFGT